MQFMFARRALNMKYILSEQSFPMPNTTCQVYRISLISTLLLFCFFAGDFGLVRGFVEHVEHGYETLIV